LRQEHCIIVLLNQSIFQGILQSWSSTEHSELYWIVWKLNLPHRFDWWLTLVKLICGAISKSKSWIVIAKCLFRDLLLIQFHIRELLSLSWERRRQVK
jgi:hypothetical protein